MPIDWITALGAEDNSLEGLMAKRQLANQGVGQAIQVANLQREQQAQKDALAEKEREFALRQQELAEQHRATEAYRQVNEADRRATMRREQYGTVTSRLQDQVLHGVAPNVPTKEEQDLINEFEPGALTENVDLSDPNHPIRKQLYHEVMAKALAAVNDANQKLKQHERDLADQRMKNENNANARAEKASQRAEKAATQRQQENDRKARQLPTPYQQRLNANMQNWQKANSGPEFKFGEMRYETQDEYDARRQAEFDKQMNTLTADAVQKGFMKQPGNGAVESPAHRAWRMKKEAGLPVGQEPK